MCTSTQEVGSQGEEVWEGTVERGGEGEREGGEIEGGVGSNFLTPLRYRLVALYWPRADRGRERLTELCVNV